MNIITEKREQAQETGTHMIHEHRGPVRPLPPHERKSLVHVEFDETDWNVLRTVFGDEDTASAAAEIIMEAPPEIQILAIQLINIIEEVA